MRKKRSLLTIIYSLMLSFVFILNVHANTGTTHISGTINYDYINEVLKIVNDNRAKENLKPLVLDSELTKRANLRASEISYLFSHTRPDGSTCFTAFDDLGNTALGENIAYGQISPSAVMTSWMNSKDHKANIMAETESSKLFTTIGIGHIEINGTNYWVQLFGNNTTSTLNKSGTEAVTEDVTVTIPDEELDFSPSVIVPFGSDITIDYNETTGYHFFKNSRPIIRLNNHDVELKTSDYEVTSDDASVAWPSNMGFFTAEGNGSTKVHFKYGSYDYYYNVTVTNSPKEILKNVTVNDATLSFKAGDKPVFTGVPGSDKYTIHEWWSLYDETLKPADRRTTYDEENPITVFEAGKKYTYHVAFEISPDYYKNTLFAYGITGQDIALTLNGETYLIEGTDIAGYLLYGFDELVTIEIHESTKEVLTDFTVNNVTTNVNAGDNVRDAFTATSGSEKYEIVETWSKNGVSEETEASDGSMDREGRLGAFEPGNRYYYGLEVKIKPEYRGMYEMPSDYDTPVTLTLNGKEYHYQAGSYNNISLYFDEINHQDIESDTKKIVIVDKIEVDNATLNFNVGDKPVFTGKAKGNNYTLTEAWMEKFYHLPEGTGGIYPTNSSDEEENAENKEYDEYFETFEQAKGYEYHLSVKLQDTDSISYMFPASGYVTLILNGTEYKLDVRSNCYHTKELYFWDGIVIEMPYIINNAALDIKAGDNLMYTATADTEDYIVDEFWTEYTKDEGHYVDDNYWSRPGSLTGVKTFEKGKKYSYSLRFNMQCSGWDDYFCGNFYLEKGKNIKVIVNDKEYDYLFPDNEYQVWLFKDIMVFDLTEEDIPITSITLNEEDLTLTEGDTKVISYTINPENTTDDKTVTWLSNNESVVKVENGKIEALKEGTTFVTVTTSNGKTAKVNVTVKKKLIPITSITLNEESLTLTEGDTKVISYTINPENTTDDKTVTWLSNNESVVKVENGKIEALKEGTTFVTVTTSNGKTAKVNVTVKKKVIPITEVKTSKVNYELTEGESELLDISVLPENHTMSAVYTITSSDKSIADIDQGFLIAKKAGKVTINIAVGEVSTTINVTVKKKLIPITSITLNEEDLTLTEGDTKVLSYTINPENTTDDKTVTWLSNNESVVKVENGKIEALKEGTTFVTVITSNGKTATLNIIVKKKLIPIAEIKLSEKELSLTEGESKTIIATIGPENTTDDKTVTWLSNNENIVKVENGQIIALKAGTSTITATTTNGLTEKINVTVKKRLIPVTGITLSTHTMDIYSVDSINVIFTPDNADIDWDKVKWATSDESILVVVDGELYPVNIGEAKVIVSYENYQDEATINVRNIGDSSLGFIKVNDKEYITKNRRVYIKNQDKLSLSDEYTSHILNNIINNSNNKLTWQSGWNDGINVNENGIASYNKIGEYYVMATLGGYKSEMLRVFAYDVIDNNAKTIYIGESTKFQIKFITSLNASANGYKIWKISDNNIGTITSDGTFTAKNKGKAKITVYDSNNSEYTYTFDIEVKERDKNIFEVYYDNNTDTIVIKNSNGTATLVIEDITEETPIQDIPKYNNQDLITLYDIHFEVGNNNTFDNPIYKVRIPINFNIDNYENISVVYLKDNKIVENFAYKIIDNKYIEFTTNHFSNYAIYGNLKNTLENQEQTTYNPKTNDNIQNYITTLVLSLITLISICNYKVLLKKNANNLK